MKTDRPVGAVAAVAALGVVACCGFPVLLSVSAGVTIAGLGLRSWALAVAGLLVVVIAGRRLARHRACQAARPTEPQRGDGDAHRNRTR